MLSPAYDVLMHVCQCIIQSYPKQKDENFLYFENDQLQQQQKIILVCILLSSNFILKPTTKPNRDTVYLNSLSSVASFQRKLKLIIVKA